MAIIDRLIVKPQLARKRQTILIPSAAKALIPQPTPKVVHVIQDNKPKETKPSPSVQVQRTVVEAVRPTYHARHNIVVNRPRSLKRQESRNKDVRYITPDVSTHEQEKVRNLKGRGIGKILVIIGNGPSINEIPLQLLRNHPYIDTMSINKPDDRVWPTTYWSFFDQSQFRRHRDLWEHYDGIIFNSPSIKQARPGSIQIKNLGGFGFSKNLVDGLYIGRSSVYAAMQIGLWLDYHTIYITGCDMSLVDGKAHFYGINPDAPPDERASRFAKEAEWYSDAAEKLSEEDRKKFIFCSSYLKYQFADKFNRIDHNEAVPRLLQQANNMFTVQ